MPETDIITQIFQYNIAGIPIIIIAGVIAFLFYFLYKPKKEDQYRKISLSKEVKREIKQIFDISEENLGYGKSLTIGPTKIGYIYKMINFNWSDIHKGNPTSEQEVKADELQKLKPENIQKQFYGFKVGKKGLVNKVMVNLFGKGTKYYFVDKELVTLNPLEVVINPYSQYVNFIDIIVFSEAGKGIISDIAFKLTLEQTLEDLLNYLPKMSYLELKQSKFAGKLDKLTEVESEKYKKRLETLTED